MRRHPTRRGFTLIELLVTMGLIVLLLSIAVAVSNSATLDSYKINGSADRVAQALITAKSRAARDRAPRGVRFLPDNTGFLAEMIYIEQPEPWLPDQSHWYGNNTVNQPIRSQLVLKYPQRVGSGAPNYQKPLPNECEVFLLLTGTNWGQDTATLDVKRFQDQFYVRTGPNTFVPTGETMIAASPELSAAFGFTSVVPALLEYAPPGMTVLRLNVTQIVNPDLAAGQTPAAHLPPTHNPPRATVQTTQFAIHSPAKPLAGEPTVILGKNCIVDPLASLAPYATGAPPLEILFSPQGHVMSRSEGMIALLVRDVYKFPNPQTNPADPNYPNWLRDATYGPANYNQAGELVLVAIYPRTGTVVTKPVNAPDGTANSDPYKFARDAINTGL